MEARLAIVCRIVRFMELCLEMHNFSTCFALLAGFESSVVLRLTDTMSRLPSKVRKAKEEIAALLSPAAGFAAYKHKLESVRPPCIPYLGLHLRDLVAIEEGTVRKAEEARRKLS
jgi:hypothetical protein